MELGSEKATYCIVQLDAVLEEANLWRHFTDEEASVAAGRGVAGGEGRTGRARRLLGAVSLL